MAAFARLTEDQVQALVRHWLAVARRAQLRPRRRIPVHVQTDEALKLADDWDSLAGPSAASASQALASVAPTEPDRTATTGSATPAEVLRRLAAGDALPIGPASDLRELAWVVRTLDEWFRAVRRDRSEAMSAAQCKRESRRYWTLLCQSLDLLAFEDASLSVGLARVRVSFNVYGSEDELAAALESIGALADEHLESLLELGLQQEWLQRYRTMADALRGLAGIRSFGKRLRQHEARAERDLVLGLLEQRVRLARAALRLVFHEDAATRRRIASRYDAQQSRKRRRSGNRSDGEDRGRGRTDRSRAGPWPAARRSPPTEFDDEADWMTPLPECEAGD